MGVLFTPLGETGSSRDRGIPGNWLGAWSKVFQPRSRLRGMEHVRDSDAEKKRSRTSDHRTRPAAVRPLASRAAPPGQSRAVVGNPGAAAGRVPTLDEMPGHSRPTPGPAPRWYH